MVSYTRTLNIKKINQLSSTNFNPIVFIERKLPATRYPPKPIWHSSAPACHSHGSNNSVMQRNIATKQTKKKMIIIFTILILQFKPYRAVHYKLGSVQVLHQQCSFQQTINM